MRRVSDRLGGPGWPARRPRVTPARAPRAVLLLGVLALAALLGWACGKEGPSADAVAMLGSDEVSYQAFAAFVESQTDSSPAALESAVLSSLLDQYLDERLLVRMAEDRGLPGVGRGLDSGAAEGSGDGPSASGHRQALAALLAADPVSQPTEEELRALYESEVEEHQVPARVNLSQILVEDRSTAEEVAARLAEGTDFAAMARRYSVDPSAPYGGSQGALSRADLPEELVDIIFALEPGEVSDIVEAEYGFHIFMVTERLPERTVPFEEAAAELRARLWDERADARLAELVEDARNRYTVRVYDENLPFDYRGTYPRTDLASE